MTYTTANTAKGQRVVVSELRGYRLHQERPMECRTWAPGPDGTYTHGCVCGECDGRSVKFPGVVERVIFYADNSVEAEVACDDGQTRRLMLEAPKGDPC